MMRCSPAAALAFSARVTFPAAKAKKTFFFSFFFGQLPNEWRASDGENDVRNNNIVVTAFPRAASTPRTRPRNTRAYPWRYARNAHVTAQKLKHPNTVVRRRWRGGWNINIRLRGELKTRERSEKRNRIVRLLGTRDELYGRLYDSPTRYEVYSHLGIAHRPSNTRGKQTHSFSWKPFLLLHPPFACTRDIRAVSAKSRVYFL